MTIPFAALLDGVQAGFLVAAPLGALGLIVVLRLPEVRLRTGVERRRDDAHQR
jgi:hypothetical protein